MTPSGVPRWHGAAWLCVGPGARCNSGVLERGGAQRLAARRGDAGMTLVSSLGTSLVSRPFVSARLSASGAAQRRLRSAEDDLYHIPHSPHLRLGRMPRSRLYLRPLPAPLATALGAGEGRSRSSQLACAPGRRPAGKTHPPAAPLPQVRQTRLTRQPRLWGRGGEEASGASNTPDERVVAAAPHQHSRLIFGLRWLGGGGQ